jgi:nitrate reductase gamma subunit
VYHLLAVGLGGTAGIVCWSGILILTCRRLLIKAVRRAGSLADIVTELMLLAVITLGNCLTLGYQLFVHEYNYRETVSVWLRRLPLFDPDPSIMSEIPWIYQAHILAAFTLLAFWPFSRLVHVWTAPVQYIRRLQILYRGPRQAPAPVLDGQGSFTWYDVVARDVSRTWRSTFGRGSSQAAQAGRRSY